MQPQLFPVGHLLVLLFSKLILVHCFCNSCNLMQWTAANSYLHTRIFQTCEQSRLKQKDQGFRFLVPFQACILYWQTGRIGPRHTSATAEDEPIVCEPSTCKLRITSSADIFLQLRTSFRESSCDFAASNPQYHRLASHVSELSRLRLLRFFEFAG